MARRGFFAELQHQSRVAARERERDERDAFQRHVAAVTRTKQAKKDWERSQAQLAKAADSERKRLEKEAREAHVAAMESGGYRAKRETRTDLRGDRLATRLYAWGG